MTSVAKSPKLTRKPKLNLVLAGARLGAKSGFILAAYFTLSIILMLNVVSAFTNSFFTFTFSGYGLFFLLVGYFYGVLPATILGAITGLITGLLLPIVAKSRRDVGKLGLAISIGFLLFLTLITKGGFWYYGFLVLPAIIYLLAIRWLAYKLYRLSTSEQTSIDKGISFWKLCSVLFVANLVACFLPGLITVALLIIGGIVWLVKPQRIADKWLRFKRDWRKL